MANDQYGIRKYLTENGFAGGDISYSDGNVYAKGKKFISATPQAADNPTLGLMKDSTYANTSDLSKALNDYNYPIHAYDSNAGAPPANTSVTMGTLPQLNPITNNFKAPTGQVAAPTNENLTTGSNYLKDYAQRLQQAPATASAPAEFKYDQTTDPLYQNAMQQALKNAQVGQDNAMVSLGNRGIGNSSIAVDRANQIQQREVGNVTSSVLPSLITQAYDRYKYQNDATAKAEQENYNRNNTYNQGFLSLADVYNKQGLQDINLGNQAENRDYQRVTRGNEQENRLIDLAQQNFTNKLSQNQDARAEGSMTGNYMPPGARESINTIVNLKRQAEQAGVTPEQMAQFKASADAERAKLNQMGVDPNVVGFDANYDQASQSAANYRGIPTLQGQGQQFNQNLETKRFGAQEAQREWDNTFKDKTFNAADAQRLWENTFKEKSFDQGVKQFAQQLGVDYTRIGAQQQQFVTEMAFKQKAQEIDAARYSDTLKERDKNNSYDNGLKAYKETGEMPDYMSQFGINVQGLKNEKTKAEVQGLYGDLSSGKLTPEKAIQTIDDAEKLGLKDKDVIDQLRKTIYLQFPEYDPVKAKEQQLSSTNQNKFGHRMFGG